jgi:hypothetical protein
MPLFFGLRPKEVREKLQSVDSVLSIPIRASTKERAQERLDMMHTGWEIFPESDVVIVVDPEEEDNRKAAAFRISDDRVEKLTQISKG